MSSIQDPFLEIDYILDDWLPKYGLTVFREVREGPARYIHVIDNSGDRYDIWIDNLGDSKYSVNGFERPAGKKGRSVTLGSNISMLMGDLDKVYQIVVSWIEDRGHKRTWV